MEKFEGPEKKLEIVLFASHPGLRENTDGRWERVVCASGAEILKRKSGEKLDAYLLSESSLFVWDDRILIITCGKTSPAMALPVILEFIQRQKVAFLFYERKNQNFPDEQPTDFENEQAYLLNYFLGRSTRLGSAARDHIHVFYYANSHRAPAPDASLQVLMHDIDPGVAQTFFHDNARRDDRNAILRGLTEFFPAMNVDTHCFYPQGYSLNGISGPHYFTVHVTPQPEASYASFETNVMARDYSRVTEEIVSLFKPRRFSLVLTTSRDSQCKAMHSQINADQPGYLATDRMRHAFDRNYMATFSNFLKQP
ncbi:MAG: hypothetical protein JSW39_21280 [Desulfobacterales bacterium]|nr:MAG: hypothetical protein JSW39_21280 [Desulfobacterales bacterium]